MIRASAATDNHICSVSSEHICMFTSRASRQCIVIGPVSVFVGGFFYQGRTQEGADGAEALPEMLNILRVF